jgi:hypothetical protein
MLSDPIYLRVKRPLRDGIALRVSENRVIPACLEKMLDQPQQTRAN